MSALESSVTLEDVFSVVEAKRVPLAPELAGYLTLEVADGSQAAGGEVDPRTVYISEEGTVALVRPKKDAPSGDAETSVRAILTKLLEASGSATPALTASAKRKAGAGLPALVSELEAALIPVNRAAGRRALARLAREVKRVTLGLGRNASVPPPVPRAGAQPRPAAPKDPVVEDVMSCSLALFPSLSRLRYLRQWGGIMDMSMDGSPIIDRTPIEGLYLNGGWCYGGFKATPASGWCFSHTIASGTPHRLNAAYRLDRFATGHVIDESGHGAVPNLH